MTQEELVPVEESEPKKRGSITARARREGKQKEDKAMLSPVSASIGEVVEQGVLSFDYRMPARGVITDLSVYCETVNVPDDKHELLVELTVNDESKGYLPVTEGATAISLMDADVPLEAFDKISLKFVPLQLGAATDAPLATGVYVTFVIGLRK